MKKRYQLRYRRPPGKLAMYLLCQQYHMAGSVVNDSDGNLLLELCGEENVIRPFLDILVKEFHKQLPCEMVELEGKPDYGIGDFRIG